MYEINKVKDIKDRKDSKNSILDKFKSLFNWDE
jgi:hypothetical protein